MQGTDLSAAEDSTGQSSAGLPWGGFALGVAAAGTVGSLYLSIGLGLKACPLCFYQRSFIMAAGMALAMSLCREGVQSARGCVTALPLAICGLGVAMFHEFLVLSGKLECPPALLGWGDGPAQSLAVFVTLTVLCLAGACFDNGDSRPLKMKTVLLAGLAGTGLSWACIRSAPPLPPVPAQPYDPVKQPFDMCRPPFVRH